MKRKKRVRGRTDPPCASLHEDDGIDPRKYFGPERETKRDIKTRRLCGMVARTLDLVFAGECGDSVLCDLTVQSVTPAPDASRLAVAVQLTIPHDGVGPREVLERLTRAHGLLRSAVAAAIDRKRVPELTFRVLPGEDVAT